MEELIPGSTVHGFSILRCEKLPEIDGKAYLLKHDKSGARLLYLKNSDSNKAFSISFRTPPQDSTGVFHILEHSVLNGSEKFPVKEPFVNLLKSSMQTFLNALTFSDKTMYPVASTNEQDLINLMDVYLDAVFHPTIYRKRAVFEQEGWHYELADESESASGRLRYNGVVYNEMKGALSDPSSVLFDELQAALFPDSAYRFESGGEPSVIPTLTYEGYLDEHRRHYRLDNSYLTLYGDVSIDSMLEFLDEQYLSPVADEQAADRAQRIEDSGLTEADLAARTLKMQAPVRSLGNVRTMDTAPENACMGAAFVIGTSSDRTRVMAVDVLLDAIMGSNEAPLKRALLDAELAGDAVGTLAEATLQPFVVLELKGLKDGASARFRQTVRNELERLASGGLDHALIEASLSRYEFLMRESEYGMADGVALAISALSGWLYDDEQPTRYLKYEDDFALLRAALDTTYFEDLIREVFLDNPHEAEVEVRPEPAVGPTDEQQRLADVEASMSHDDFARIEADVESLRALQAQPDTPEALATLPRLLRSDVQDAPAEPSYYLDKRKPVPCLRHDVPTHGIAYVYGYFDLDSVDFEELPYVSILCSVLGKLGTQKHNASELDTLVNGKLGNLSFFTELYESDSHADLVRPKLVVGASALSKQLAHLATLPQEVMLATDFSDTEKIRDILAQRKIGMEQSFAQAGHSAAMSRVSSYYQPSGVLRQQLGGVEFYRFLKDLLAHFEERAETLSQKLTDLARRLFTRNGLTLSFAGSSEDYDAYWNAADTLPASLDAERHSLVIPKPRILNEAFIVPTDVSYTSLGYDRRQLGAALPYTASWQVGVRALTYDYLWNEVRVRGGAYGVGFQATRTGALRFYSYRDPHVDETLERFKAAPSWLRGFRPTEADFDGYVVSSVAGFDNPLKARALLRRQDAQHFMGRTAADRLKTRSEILEADHAALLQLADVIDLACEKNACCTFGNKEIVANAKAGFDVVDLLNE